MKTRKRHTHRYHLRWRMNVNDNDGFGTVLVLNSPQKSGQSGLQLRSHRDIDLILLRLHRRLHRRLLYLITDPYALHRRGTTSAAKNPSLTRLHRAISRRVAGHQDGPNQYKQREEEAKGRAFVSPG